MTSIKRFLTLLALTGLVIVGCLLPAADEEAAVTAKAIHDEDGLPRETRHELSRARKATARYRDI